jgi:uncharacterized protein (TIGR03067 family)
MWTVQIAANRLTVTNNRTLSSLTYRLSVDRAARPPSYDLFDVNDGSPKFLGIYRVDGDTLTECYNQAKYGRPTAFDGPGQGVITEVYKRAR